MKKLFIFGLLLLTSIALTACSEDVEEAKEPEKEKEQIEERVLRENERIDIIKDFDLTNVNYKEPTKAFELHSMIADDVIFQQGKNIRVFGKAEPNTIVLVKLTKDERQKESYTNYGFADANGEFLVELPALEASFYSYTLTVSDTVNETLVENCLIGEVWLSSGQSNMELKVSEMHKGEFTYSGINEQFIRVFKQEREWNNIAFPYEVAYDVHNGEWLRATSYENISDVSGIALSFAYETFYEFISQGKQVPIAIINTAIGGTHMHSWLPREEVTSSNALKTYVNNNGFNYDDEDWNDRAWSNYNQVSALYNSRIAPLGNFNIKGVMWYQGETDPVYEISVISIQKLIKSWSKLFNKNDELLYFSMIQLAPYDGVDPFEGPSTKNYSYVGFAHHRRAQFDIAMMEE